MRVFNFLGTALVVPALAFGWGGGHDTVGRAVASRLPEPWRDGLHGKALATFCADNHYPDSFLKLAEDARITPEERAFLAGHKMAVRYHFHSDQGRGVAFALLVRALREDRPESVLLWFAVLAHSTADMVACNHDPIVHVATYGWGEKDWDIWLPNGMSLAKMQPCLDLGWVEKEPEATAIWEKRIAKVAAADSGKGAEEAALDVMLAGLQGVGTCSAYGKPIVGAAAGWTVTGKPEYREALAESLSELGAWAVERLLRDFLAAQRLAAAGLMPDVTESVEKRYQAAMAGFVSSRDFQEDSFVKGLTAPQSPEKPFLGVLAEPTWRMNDGMFGANDRVLAAQSVTALRKQGKNAALVDVRKVLASGIHVAQVPAVLVFAQKVGAYYSLDPKVLTEQLVKYRAAGGKIVWVGGGVPDPALCGFPKGAATRADIGKGYPYAWTRLPVGTNAYATLTLKVGDRAARKLERSPNFGAGWHVPSNTTAFKPEAAGSILPLAYLFDRETPLLVGGAWPKGAPDVAYLPTYTVFPYLWTRELPALIPFELGLDAQGLDALAAAFAALRADRLF